MKNKLGRDKRGRWEVESSEIEGKAERTEREKKKRKGRRETRI